MTEHTINEPTTPKVIINVLVLNEKYYNGIGEVRQIVEYRPEDAPYVFIDHLNWSYTASGVNDEYDTYWGDIRYDLHRIAPKDSIPTLYDKGKHL